MLSITHSSKLFVTVWCNLYSAVISQIFRLLNLFSVVSLYSSRRQQWRTNSGVYMGETKSSWCLVSIFRKRDDRILMTELKSSWLGICGVHPLNGNYSFQTANGYKQESQLSETGETIYILDNLLTELYFYLVPLANLNLLIQLSIIKSSFSWGLQSSVMLL